MLFFKIHYLFIYLSRTKYIVSNISFLKEIYRYPMQNFFFTVTVINKTFVNKALNFELDLKNKYIHI